MVRLFTKLYGSEPDSRFIDYSGLCKKPQPGPMISSPFSFMVLAVFATGMAAGYFISGASDVTKSFTAERPQPIAAAPSPAPEPPPLPAPSQPIESKPVRVVPILPSNTETSGAARSEPAKKDSASDSRAAKPAPKCDRRACRHYRSFDASTCTYKPPPRRAASVQEIARWRGPGVSLVTGTSPSPAG